ncbi:3-hydroxyacyl-CoA dehydrogenase family protein [Streptomyces sp. NPDC050161]|uniref:3-hydroxyacyl-CoA dehydrogenase family protein n=1 Tax=Streptomyces sp. NPDC050161 TaxID=3365604 RepID=UPI00379530FF
MTFTLPATTQDRPVTVIGAGTLGRRIALMFATRGGLVRVYDPSAEAGEAACAYVAQELPDVVKTIDGGRPGTVESVTDLPRALADAWLVVEAVPERLDLKKRIFRDLDELAEPDAILASNSSSYATSNLVDSVRSPERLLNLHFYMPPRQNAADVMSCGRTDHGAIELLLKVLPEYGIHPFEARRESTGFIFNRVWAAIKRESLAVVADGVSTPADVDRMWQLNMGVPVGPFRMMDSVGLDVVLDIENHYAAERPGLPEGPRELLRTYVDAGRLGVKTGSGFYDDYRQQV